MEEILAQLGELGLNTTDGIGYTGSPEKYISALKKFTESCGENSAEVNKHLSSGRTQRYMVKVHALKSNSKMIGSTTLFAAFESLELAAQRSDIAFIDAGTERVLAEYTALAEAVSGIIGAAETVPAVSAVPALSAEEAEDTAKRLLCALEDFDDELSAELAEKLSGFPFAEEQKELLNTAKKHIGEFMYDEAIELIWEIYPYIRG